MPTYKTHSSRLASFTLMNYKRVNQKLAMLLAVIGLAFFTSDKTFGQGQWSLSFPEETRNGYFFINSPKSSDKFYLFGHDVQALNVTSQSLTAMADLPTDILPKENVTGYTAPNRHMDIFTWDEQKWWIVNEGRILKTTDAGNTWLEVLSLSPNTQYLSSSYFTSIHFPSENVGYAVGTADKIFRTLDGGNNWEELQWSNTTAPYRRLSSVYFVTESVGFALGYEVDDILLNIGVYKPLYYFTADAGQTWTETTFPESDHHYVDLQIVEEQTWYLSLTNRNFIAPNDKLFKSTNGGKNWNEITLPGNSTISSLVMRAMHWFTPDEGLILGSSEFFGSPNHIYKTYDAGQTWTEILLDAGSTPFFTKIPNLAMKFNGNHGIIAGATGNLLYSDDKGETWQNLQKGMPDVHDMSSDNGYTYAALYGNALLKHDGMGWIELSAPLNSQYQKAAFNKVSNFGSEKVAVNDIYGEIHYSQDGGNTWSSLFTSLEDRVLDIQFVNGNLAALVYSNNQLQYFSNVEDRQNMEIIIDGTPLPASIFDLFYIGDVLFTRVESFLFKRVNGIWEKVFFNNAFIRSLMMDEKGNAMMRFADKAYHYSNDSGQTWQVATFSDEVLNRVDFSISNINGFGYLNDTTHYALVHGSSATSERFETTLLLSSDNGASWELADFATFSEPHELGQIGHVVDNKGNLWVGTANANIYKWLLDRTVTGVKDPIQPSIKIYPNPTRSSITIDNPLEIESYQLFNLQGQIIASGSFDGSTNLEIPEQQATGVYILHLLTNKGERKMAKILKE